VRWEKLTPEAADIMASWELDKCGFSLFIGSTISASDRDGLRHLLRYLMRSPVSFNRLTYNERTGQVTMRLKREQVKVFPHAIDFLAALSRHVPRRRQQTVTYAGYYANASGSLSSKPEEPDDEDTANLTSTKPRRYIPWNVLVFKSWAVDPELCPKCHEKMDRKEPIYKQPKLSELLKSLKIGHYPERPPPRAPPPINHLIGSPTSEDRSSSNVVPLFVDNTNQHPQVGTRPGW
jgi:hypothetical protein